MRRSREGRASTLSANQFPSCSGPRSSASGAAASAGSLESCFQDHLFIFRRLFEHLPANSCQRNFHPAAPATFTLPRKLSDADREGLNERKALALMLAQPSMIKRPVLDLGGKLLVGFKPEIYAKEVAASGGARRRKA